MYDELVTVSSNRLESNDTPFEFPAARAPLFPASAVSGVSIRPRTESFAINYMRCKTGVQDALLLANGNCLLNCA